MTKIIHITDPHLVARGERLHDLDPFARLQEAVSDITCHHADAALCVITGDLTHHGRPEEYQAFRAAVEGLPMPVRLLIGNHDDRSAFRAAFPETGTDAAGFIQHELLVENDETALLFLDTGEPGTHAGRYCHSRRAWLAQRLRSHARRRVLLFMHHAPIRLGIAAIDALMLEDHQALQTVIHQAGNVTYCVFGHVHRPVSGIWAGVPFAAIRGTNHQVWLDFSLEKGIPCSHELPMYGIIMLSESGIVYHAHEFNDTSRKYVYVPEEHRAAAR